MVPDDSLETIENGSAAFSFDRGSGALASVRNRVTGNEYLQGTAERGNVFAVYYDFTGEFEITGSERESPHAATLAAAISDSVFSPFQAGTPRFARGGSGDARTLTVEYDHPCGELLLTATTWPHRCAPGSASAWGPMRTAASGVWL